MTCSMVGERGEVRRSRLLDASRLADQVGFIDSSMGCDTAISTGTRHAGKCGNRAGDNAPMAYVELVDRPRTDAAADAG
jgi:hypothetical protein